jgi:hypothetical protein
METIIESLTLGGRKSQSPKSIALGGAANAAATPINIPSAGGAAAALAANAKMNHAQSFLDCESVLMQAAVKSPKPSTPLALQHNVSRPAQQGLLGGELLAVQEDEDEMAQVGRAAPLGLGRPGRAGRLHARCLFARPGGWAACLHWAGAQRRGLLLSCALPWRSIKGSAAQVW